MASVIPAGHKADFPPGTQSISIHVTFTLRPGVTLSAAAVAPAPVELVWDAERGCEVPITSAGATDGAGAEAVPAAPARPQVSVIGVETDDKIPRPSIFSGPDDFNGRNPGVSIIPDTDGSGNVVITIKTKELRFGVTYVVLSVPVDQTLGNVTTINTRFYDVTNIPGTLCTTEMSGTILEKSGTALLFAVYRRPSDTEQARKLVAGGGTAEDLRNAELYLYSLHVLGKGDPATLSPGFVTDLMSSVPTEYPTALVTNTPPERFASADAFKKKKVSVAAEAAAVAEARAAARPVIPEMTPDMFEGDYQFRLNGETVTFGISWDRSSANLDLDLACVLVDWGGTILDMCDCNHRVVHNGSIRHSGDSRVGDSDFRYGAGNGDDEQILVDMNMLEMSADTPSDVYFVVSAHNGYITDATNLRAHLVEGRDGSGVVRLAYHMKNLPQNCQGIVMCCLPKFYDRHVSERGRRQFRDIQRTFDGNHVVYSFRAIRDASWPLTIDETPRYQKRPSAKIAALPIGARKEDNGVVPGVRPPPGQRPDLPAPPPLIPTSDADKSPTGHQSLWIIVHWGVNLLGADDKGRSSDPYVVMSLTYSPNKKQTAKTRVIKKTLNPCWEEYHEIQGPFTEAETIKFDVFDKDLIGKDYLGSGTISLRDVWRCKTPQTVYLSGVAYGYQAAKGQLFVTVSWENVYTAAASGQLPIMQKFNPA